MDHSYLITNIYHRCLHCALGILQTMYITGLIHPQESLLEAYPMEHCLCHPLPEGTQIDLTFRPLVRDIYWPGLIFNNQLELTYVLSLFIYPQNLAQDIFLWLTAYFNHTLFWICLFICLYLRNCPVDWLWTNADFVIESKHGVSSYLRFFQVFWRAFSF